METFTVSEKRLHAFALTVCAVFLSGCATVKIYSDAEMKKETGIRYYTLRPYLLVEYLAEKDKTVKTSVIYLPDLSAPQYAVMKSGVGKSDLKMGLTNGSLQSYGAALDSQLPQSMEAFAAMLSKSAYAAQAFTGPESPGTGNREPGAGNQEPGTSFRLFEILPSASGSVLREVNLSEN